VANIARTVADAQITNGGPIILYQPENEYTHFCCGLNGPDGDYMQYVIDQVRNAGVVIPIISNDASPYGTNAPGTGPGAVDIYGHDGYPLGDGCVSFFVFSYNSSKFANNGIRIKSKYGQVFQRIIELFISRRAHQHRIH
jgi:hypothetical protein